MQHLALVIAVAALAVAGWTYLERPSAPAAEVDAAGTGALESRLEALADEIRALREQRGPLAGRPVPTAARGPGLTAPEPAPAGTRAEVVQGTIEERLAELESWREDREEADRDAAAVPHFRSMQRKMITDADSAQKALDLSASQRADLERIIDDTRLEIDRLMDTPDEDGVTLRSLQKDTGVSISGGGSIDMSKILANAGKVQAFKNRTIPGRNETYAQAENRIRDDAKRRIRDSLTEEQRGKYDNSFSEPLIPRAGTGGAISVAFATDVVTTDES
ncbi:MAG: hypothetical protein AB7T63_15790 [Planctomycetota bacterium]